MGYGEALEAAGCKVLQFEEFGSYQGEWLALVTHNGETGVVHGYYGSCSGCDAFEAEFGWGDEENPGYQQRLADFGETYLPVVPIADWLKQQEDRIANCTDEDGYCWDSEAIEMLDTVKVWAKQKEMTE